MGGIGRQSNCRKADPGDHYDYAHAEFFGQYDLQYDHWHLRAERGRQHLPRHEIHEHWTLVGVGQAS